MRCDLYPPEERREGSVRSGIIVLIEISVGGMLPERRLLRIIRCFIEQEPNLV